MPLPLLPQGTLDFTNINREDVLVRLQRLAHQVNPEWDDFSAAFPENLLLELTTFHIDLIRGTMEERARQANWATLTDRLAAIRLGKINSFLLPGGAPATLTGTFTTLTGAPVSVNVPIPEGLSVRTTDPTDPKRYRVTAAAAITPGLATIDASLEQAEVVTESFDSTLEPNIELLLHESPYIDGSLTVTANDGDYTSYSTFLGVAASTKAFVVMVDDQGRARVRFGNGINGSIPQGTITVTYKVGGGVAGEVEAGANWIIEDAITDDAGTAVSLVMTNASSSQPAADPMTVAEARVRGPQSIKTIERAVIDDDFEYAALTVPGLARAFLATSDNTDDVAEDTGRLDLVAFGTELASGRYAAAAPSAAKIAEVQGLFAQGGAYRSVQGFTVSVGSAIFTTVDVSVRVYKEANYTGDAVSTNVRAAIADFFAVALDDKTPNPNVDFGARLLGSDGVADYTLGWSDLFGAILAATGVRRISPQSNNLLLSNVHGSVILASRGFPIPGTIIVFDEDEGGAQI